MTPGAALERARAAIGAPFRLHGRDPASGLDCVGLAAFAWDVAPPTGYALRCGSMAQVERWLATLGFTPRRDAGPGAVAIVAAGAGQLHLGILAERGIIHADATARRVVERGEPLPWPVLGRWIGEN
ncbi:peptidoglycan endopeptidase [uncultured Sphingomonas sp.]|uniref:peptidoglycan endopeptidase n=1 Tax=uncultured Sphingomonas sp. TaxID=158754 RepID=UPI0035CBD9B4